MHNNYLNISLSLEKLCNESKMKNISKIVLEADENSMLGEEELKEYLKLFNNNLVKDNLCIDIRRKERLTVKSPLILSVTGSYCGQ